MIETDPDTSASTSTEPSVPVRPSVRGIRELAGPNGSVSLLLKPAVVDDSLDSPVGSVYPPLDVNFFPVCDLPDGLPDSFLLPGEQHCRGLRDWGCHP